MKHNLKMLLAIVLLWIAVTLWLILLAVPSLACGLLGVVYGYFAMTFYSNHKEY